MTVSPSDHRRGYVVLDTARQALAADAELRDAGGRVAIDALEIDLGEHALLEACDDALVDRAVDEPMP